MAGSKSVIVASTVATGALSYVGAIRDPARAAQPIRIAAGTFMAGTMLAFLAEFAPELAAGLAALMLVTAAFVAGGPGWAAISSITAQRPTSRTGPAK